MKWGKDEWPSLWSFCEIFNERLAIFCQGSFTKRRIDKKYNSEAQFEYLTKT